jgi:SPP1 family predicted phage head-tail adaptor
MSCDLCAGKLRHSIVIQKFIGNKTPAGGWLNDWNDYATVKAYIKPISGNERLYAMRLESSVTHKIYIRYRNDVNASNRINYKNRLFNIKYVINIEEMNRWLELDCEEGENG